MNQLKEHGLVHIGYTVSGQQCQPVYGVVKQHKTVSFKWVVGTGVGQADFIGHTDKAKQSTSSGW